MFFHEHRSLFNIIYHEPPKNTYFRPYRLEVDWQEDLQLIRGIAEGVSMRAPVPKIIEWLDKNQEVARVNHGRVEQTGPSCYSYETMRSWMQQMTGQPIVTWQDKIWNPPSAKAQPVYCKSGQCLLGYGDGGVLHSKAGRIKGDAYLNCDCGSGLLWNE
jgi:hypothetical protein